MIGHRIEDIVSQCGSHLFLQTVLQRSVNSPHVFRCAFIIRHQIRWLPEFGSGPVSNEIFEGCEFRTHLSLQSPRDSLMSGYPYVYPG